jgi:hypothetical protein
VGVWGEETAQTMYAHMNKRIKKTLKKKEMAQSNDTYPTLNSNNISVGQPFLPT